MSDRAQLLSGDVTTQSYLQSLHQKDYHIVELERHIRELLTSLEMTKTQCESVFTVMFCWQKTSVVFLIADVQSDLAKGCITILSPVTAENVFV